MLLGQKIIFVGGKGGVGKTTLSASLACKLSNEGKKVLIVSTDPAHSLGDALDVNLSDEPIQITPNLDALELDSDKITHSHFKNIEQTLRGYAKPEMFHKIKEHLELAKESPGAQEAATLEAICRLICFEDRYEHIIFDTAPTGHTIRLLSLPTIMSAWSDGLLKHQKDQEIVKSAAKQFWDKKPDDKFNPFKPSNKNRWDSALEKLNERKELFLNANEILTNKDKCAIFLVMIPQVLPLVETKRALESLKKFKIHCSGVFINQIIPPNQVGDFWLTQAKKQDEILLRVKDELSDENIIKVMLSSLDLRGYEKLKNIDF